jgi:sodium/proline symporter
MATSLLVLGLLSALGYVAWRTRVRVHIADDFAMARRRLPANLAGLGQAINAVPMWLTMSVAYLAATLGLAALWIVLAIFAGLLVNWWLVAPRLRAQVASHHSLTIAHWFAASAGDRLEVTTRRSAGVIAVAALLLVSATLLQWSAASVAAALGLTPIQASISIALLWAGLLVVGGLWSSSWADAIQATLWWLALLVLGVISVSAVGGFATLWSQLVARESPSGTWFAGYSGVLAIALVVGANFAALGSTVQPPAIVRYLACRSDVTLRRARGIALTGCAVSLCATLIIGWSVRALALDVVDSRSLFAAVMSHAMTPSAAGFFALAMALALALSCGSGWIAAASHLSSDLRTDRRAPMLFWFRINSVVFAMLSVVAAAYLPPAGDDWLWLAWHLLGAAFGPLLLVRLTGKRVRPGSALGAMWAGCLLTIVFYLMPDTPGDLLERTLPIVAAMGIALSGGERRRNPDRADRGDKTVHDHLPI